MATASCPTHLINDEPSVDDRFGSHEPVARVLAETVACEDGGRSIAIVGPYGAGKSTIVKLFSQHLSWLLKGAQRCSAVFPFDAWAHQGDPLRRTFLEELVQFLEREQWITKGAFQNQIAALTKKRQTTVSKSAPRLTYEGGIVAASMLAVPYGASLAGKYGPDAINILLACLPIVVILLIAIGTRLLAPGKLDNLSFLELLWNKTRDVTTGTSVTTENPTSIEFRSLFKKVLGAALRKRDDRHLVIVLDNLDRLSTGDAMSIFATMRAFFDQGHRQDDWSKRVWLMVPFDPEWTTRLLRDSADGIVEAKTYGVSFLEKSFQIRVYTSAPILTKWKAFLISLLQVTCPKHEIDFDAVYLLYAQFALSNRTLLTPRAIKIFVNRLATLHRQWQHNGVHDIPFVTQALYALMEQQQVDIPECLRDINKLDARAVAIAQDGDLTEHLAALHFNVPAEDAMQVLIGEDVTAALPSGNMDVLRRISAVSGFETVCEHVVAREARLWVQNDSASVLIAADALARLEVREPQSIWHTLISCVDRVASWEIKSHSEADGMIAILASSPRDRQEALLSRIAGRLRFASIRGWSVGPLRVLRWVAEKYPAAVAHCVKADSADEFVDLINFARKQADASTILLMLRPPEDSQSVSEVISERLQGEDSSAATEAVAITKTILHSYRDISLDTLADEAYEDLLEPAMMSAERTGADLNVLLEMAHSHDRAQQYLAELAKGGRLYHHLAQVTSSHDAAAFLFAILTNPQAEELPGNAEAGKTRAQNIVAKPDENSEVVSNLYELCVDRGSLASVLHIVKDNAQFNALAGVLIMRSLSDNKDIGDTGLDILDDYNYIKSVVSPDALERILDVATTTGTLHENLERKGFDNAFAPLYLKILGRHPNPHFQSFIESSLSKTTLAEWEVELTTCGDSLRLAVLGAAQRGIGWLKRPYQDALYALALQIIAGTASLGEYDWEQITSPLDPMSREVLARDIRDKLIWSDEGICTSLDVFGSTLIQQNVFAEKPDDVVRHLFRKLLEGANTNGLAWISRIIEAAPDIIAETGESTLRDFIDRLFEIPQADRTDVWSTIEEIVRQARPHAVEEMQRARLERPEGDVEDIAEAPSTPDHAP